MFVPLIPANTNARREGYFRLEWTLAVDRSCHFADEQTFLLPVLIDATPAQAVRLSGRFRQRHFEMARAALGVKAADAWQVGPCLSLESAVADASVMPQRGGDGTLPKG